MINSALRLYGARHLGERLRRVPGRLRHVPGRLRHVPGRLRHVRGELHRLREEGAATAEYAVVIMAAVGFAGLLVAILRGDAVRQLLTDLVQNALTAGG